ncbi:MAG: DUF4124 domain-containing protein [Pseudomonadales bacterium]|nr:DUF4124 domain-containing protein [Pseudomonadales bacterium]
MAATRFYRYEDENGLKVIHDSIPPEMVHKGYDILGADGRLIRKVPRALTKEEIEAIKAKKESGAVLAEQAAKQAEADKRLLTIFSNPQDAERARDRKLEALDVLISVNRGNIARLKSEFEIAQQQAATRERAGQKVPDHMIEKMDRVDRQIQKLETNITEKELEKTMVREQYAKDIDRLKFLMRQQGRKVD